jgi:hypothetical protein
LNKSILATQSDYLIFAYGDCIPRSDFVGRHLEFREKGFFSFWGIFQIANECIQTNTDEGIIKQNCFSVLWFKNQGLHLSFKSSNLQIESFSNNFHLIVQRTLNNS